MKILPCAASALALLAGGCTTHQPAHSADAYVREVVIEGERLPLFRNVSSDQVVSPPIVPADLRFGGSKPVRLHVVVGEDGSVLSTHVRFARVTKGTLEAARNAVRQWHFPVISQDGRGIKYVAEVKLTYLVIITNEQAGPANVAGSYRSTTTYSVEIQ